MSEEFVNYYALLEISPNATLQQITDAYRRKSREVHPDLSSDERAKRKQQILNQAFEILKDPKRRAQYDEMLRARQARMQIGAATEPEPPPIQTGYYGPPSRAGSIFRTAALIIGCLGVGGILATAGITAFKRPPPPEDKAKVLAEREAQLQHEEATRALDERANRLKMEADAEAARRKQQSALALTGLRAVQGEGDKVFLLLKTLDAEVDAWESQVRPLLTNDRGKLLSADEQDVRAFLASWKAERPTKSDVIAIRERLTALLKVVTDELAKSEPLVLPSASLSDRIEAEGKTVEKLVEQVKGPRQQIERLLAVAERSTRTSTTPLQQAIENVNLKDLEAKNRMLAEVEIENQKKIADAEVARKKQEGESTLNAVNAKAEVEKLAAERALAREQALKRAGTPETRALLAFFFTPGYNQPDMSQTPEKRPISYGKLAARGFLDPSIDGLGRFYQLVNEKDPDRPYMKERITQFRHLPDGKRQQIMTMQRALIELGPALVELKMLDP